MRERENGADLRKLNRGFRAFVEAVKNGGKTAGRIRAMLAGVCAPDGRNTYQIGACAETLAITGANWKQSAPSEKPGYKPDVTSITSLE